LRQITLPVEGRTGTLGYLQAATPLTETHNQLQELQLALTLTVPIALGLIGLTGWLLSGIAMQPIRQSYQLREAGAIAEKAIVAHRVLIQ
jgi:two-component system, OmpR family, manganese sensing sensor histidine kinase